jgi:hypothetical protein
MGDKNYEKTYLKKKKAMRVIHKRLIETKDNQKTYHELMGDIVGEGIEEGEND